MNIETIRTNLAAAQSKVKALENPELPITFEDALARLDAHIATLTTEGNEFLRLMVGHVAHRKAPPIHWFSPNGYHVPDAMRAVEAGIVAINPSDYRKGMVERLEQFYAMPENTPMPESDRVKQLAAARAEVEKLEHAEFEYCNTHSLPLKASTRADLLLGL